MKKDRKKDPSGNREETRQIRCLREAKGQLLNAFEIIKGTTRERDRNIEKERRERERERERDAYRKIEQK